MIIEPAPRDGARNMAIDEALLESAILEKSATLRIYRWRTPTVSLGYFQPHDEPLLAERFANLPLVRRLSGGGAILHDREVTYSLVYPPGHPFGDNPSTLYDAVHTGVVKLLTGLGVAARMRGTPLAAQPFLCFGRGDARDVVIGSSKVMGSAQRRRAGGVLQHGALLIARSPFAPEFPGVTDLAAPLQIDWENVDARLAHAIAAELPELPQAGALSAREEARADELLRQRYSSPVLPRRSPARELSSTAPKRDA